MISEKDFDTWNIKKKGINATERNLLFKEGEIWWCSLGVNIGVEVYGKGGEYRRPVVIFKKLSHNSCIVMPTTTKEKKGSWFHHIYLKKRHRWVMMNQMRLISGNRLWVRESTLSNEQIKELKKSVADLLGFS